LTTDGSGNIAFEDVAGGITEADMRRLTADVSSNGDITANLERPDDASFEKIGSGMTESSGVFSFPSTGIYLVNVVAEFSVDGPDNCFLNMFVSLDGGSNYDDVARAGGGSGSNGVISSGTSFALVDVTDISNVKLKFNVSSLAGSSGAKGDTTFNRTHFTFIRLGDT